MQFIKLCSSSPWIQYKPGRIRERRALHAGGPICQIRRRRWDSDNDEGNRRCGGGGKDTFSRLARRQMASRVGFNGHCRTSNDTLTGVFLTDFTNLLTWRFQIGLSLWDGAHPPENQGGKVLWFGKFSKMPVLVRVCSIIAAGRTGVERLSTFPPLD